MVQILRTGAPNWEKGNCHGEKLNKYETPDGVYPAEIFFDDIGETKEDRDEYQEAALLYCNGDGKKRPVCPIRKECLFFALKNNEQWGIWGGMTPQDRTHMRRFLPERLWQWHPAVPREEDGTVLGGERPRPPKGRSKS